MIAIERRLRQPRWLSYAVPFLSVAVAFGLIALVLVSTGHDPGHTYRRIFTAAFDGSAAWNDTLTLATPLVFTGLAAAVAFRMQLFNIGAEGQLYIGALCASGAAIWLGPHHALVFTILAMCVCGAAGGALWALISGALKAFARTSEILTSLMLNYVAGLLLTYLIFDSAVSLAGRVDDPDPDVPAVDRAEAEPVLADGVAGQARRPLRVPARGRDRRRAVRALPADALRVRDERDRRLARGPRATRACARGGRSSR